MNKTKEKVLHTALMLFNEKGIAQVSLRIISNEVGISLGNLTYHFRKREEIIEALYLNLVAELNEAIQNTIEGDGSLKELFQTADIMIERFYEYRFIFLDFVHIIRNHEVIREHYRALLDIREQQYGYFIESMIKSKLFREALLENEYSYLFKRLRIISDFWFSANTINKHLIVRNDILEFKRLFRQMIFPYLTEKGRMEFEALM